MKLRFFPDTQSRLRRQLPNVCLGQSRCKQGRGHMMLSGRLLPGPKVALVVEVHAVGNGIEPQALPLLFHYGEQFVFAVIATGSIITQVRSEERRVGKQWR